MFVRQQQLILIDESGNRTEPASPSAAPTGPPVPDEAGANRARSRLTRYFKSSHFNDSNKKFKGMFF